MARIEDVALEVNPMADGESEDSVSQSTASGEGAGRTVDEVEPGENGEVSVANNSRQDIGETTEHVGDREVLGQPSMFTAEAEHSKARIPERGEGEVCSSTGTDNNVEDHADKLEDLVSSFLPSPRV